MRLIKKLRKTLSLSKKTQQMKLSDVNEVTENVNEAAKEISEKIEPSLLSEIKGGFARIQGGPNTNTGGSR